MDKKKIIEQVSDISTEVYNSILMLHWIPIEKRKDVRIYKMCNEIVKILKGKNELY